MNLKKLSVFAFVGALALTGCSTAQEENLPAAGTVKPRVIVTCDPELDDNNSLIRYLLYSDGFETEGIIYASSTHHWKGDGKGTHFSIDTGREIHEGTSWRWKEGERFIDEDVEAYEKVYENLKVHNPNYPTPAALKAVIREGNVMMEADMSFDTPGSDLIKQVLLDDDMRPLFLQVWGGPATVARALKSIQDEYENTDQWEAVKTKINTKARLCLSGAQDSTYTAYIRPNWPELKSVIKNTGITPMGYGWKRGCAEPSDTLYYSAEWITANMKGKGALSDNYRVWGDGKWMCPGDMADYFHLTSTREELIEQGFKVWSAIEAPGSFISEGDTPEFLNIIGNGLRAWENPTWGGWAGRQKELSEREQKMGYTMSFASSNGSDDVMPVFVADCQNSFAMRMAWCSTSDFSAVNHDPVVTGQLAVQAKAGETVKLNAKVSDPDNDPLTCSWSQWKVYEAFQGDVTIADPASAATTVTIPADAKTGDTIHLILTVKDNGTPQGTSYLRTVITIL
ncbi:MAG: DUF1593 domain-containing protein [Bacteroidales bacterium]|nr:DUF1593 domain-containing protein [Bacteroidales bacterium]